MKRGLLVVAILAVMVAVFFWPRPEVKAPAEAPKRVVAAPAPSRPPPQRPVPIPTTIAVSPPSTGQNPSPADTKEPPASHQTIEGLLSDTVKRIESRDAVYLLEVCASPVSLATVKPETLVMFESLLREHLMEGGPQVWIAVLKAMKDQTPTYNEAGDRATYEIADPTGQGLTFRPIILQKVDGQWYFTVTDILRGSIGFGATQSPPIGL